MILVLLLVLILFSLSPDHDHQAGLSLGPMILIFGCRKESMDLLKMETDKFGFVLPCLTMILCYLIVSSIQLIIHEDINKCRDLEDGPLPFKRLTAVSRENHRPSQYVQVQGRYIDDSYHQFHPNLTLLPNPIY